MIHSRRAFDASMLATILLTLIMLCVVATMSRAQGTEVIIQPQMPIVLRPGYHEKAQFGYSPGYTVNVPTFDSLNRPYIRSRSSDVHETGFIHTLRNGQWVELNFLEDLREQLPGFQTVIRGAGWYGGRVVFDADDHMYNPLKVQLADGTQANVLLYSTDYGETFQVYRLPDGDYNIEHWVGHNELSRPPLITVYRLRESHPATYSSYNDMYVIQPVKHDGGLVLEEPVHVTGNALTHARHSGHASFAVSAGDKAFLVWAEASDPSSNVPGAPTFVATYHASTNTLGEKHFLAYAPPANDGHNTPGIAMDSKGYLHVITGSHGRNFYYLRSLVPYTADEGWTDPEPTLNTGFREGHSERGRQTYLSMVIDADDTLHIVFRQWRQGVDPHFTGRLYGALSYQSRPTDGVWADATMLIVPPVTTYSVFYHKLAMDRNGQFYLTYSFRSNEGAYAATYTSEARTYDDRALLFSPDGGKTWRLATTQDFITGLDPSVRGEHALTDDLSAAATGTEQTAGVPVSMEQLWNVHRTSRSGVSLASVDREAVLEFTGRPVATVGFDLRQVAEESPRVLRFRARHTGAERTFVELLVTVQDGVGREVKSLIIGSDWSEYELVAREGDLAGIILTMTNPGGTSVAFQDLALIP